MLMFAHFETQAGPTVRVVFSVNAARHELTKRHEKLDDQVLGVMRSVMGWDIEDVGTTRKELRELVPADVVYDCAVAICQALERQQKSHW